MSWFKCVPFSDLSRRKNGMKKKIVDLSTDISVTDYLEVGDSVKGKSLNVYFGSFILICDKNKAYLITPLPA
jgi:hypothetical protein